MTTPIDPNTWRIDGMARDRSIIVDANGPIARFSIQPSFFGSEVRDAHAVFALKAAQAYAPLLKALQDIVDATQSTIPSEVAADRASEIALAALQLYANGKTPAEIKRTRRPTTTPAPSGGYASITVTRLFRADDWPGSLHLACDAFEDAAQTLVNANAPGTQESALVAYRAAKERFGEELLTFDKSRRPDVYAGKETSR